MQGEERDHGEGGSVVVYRKESLTVACLRSIPQEVADVHRNDC